MSGKKKKRVDKKLKIELASYSPETTYEQLQKVCFFAVYHKIPVLSVPLYLVDKARPYLVDTKVACLVDFPFGYSTTQIKHHSIIRACNLGADIVEMTMNNGLIFNKEWDKIHIEVKTSMELCKSKGVEFRVAVDHKWFENDYFVELCNALSYTGVDGVVTNAGTNVDDPIDNILVSKRVEKEIKVKVICASNMFTEKHIEMIMSMSEIDRIRISNYGLANRVLGSCGV
jgi:deoxyribose-phosphate aldolase